MVVDNTDLIREADALLAEYRRTVAKPVTTTTIPQATLQPTDYVATVVSAKTHNRNFKTINRDKALDEAIANNSYDNAPVDAMLVNPAAGVFNTGTVGSLKRILEGYNYKPDASYLKLLGSNLVNYAIVMKTIQLANAANRLELTGDDVTIALHTLSNSANIKLGCADYLMATNPKTRDTYLPKQNNSLLKIPMWRRGARDANGRVMTAPTAAADTISQLNRSYNLYKITKKPKAAIVSTGDYTSLQVGKRGKKPVTYNNEVLL